MKIMVFDVPAEFGGALSILKQYYKKAEEDIENEWIFAISKPELEEKEKENIKVLRFPWVKKSWFHRLWFDGITAKKLVKKHKPDKILSLQNTIINTKKCFQEVYVHQALPFSEKRFSFFENKKFWIYQNVISRKIISSVKKADTVTVQTKWMKDALCEKAGISREKVNVVQPSVRIPGGAKYEKNSELIFFYPASNAVYKNHEIIYKAVQQLKEEGYGDFKVVLTIQKPVWFDEKYGEIADIIEFHGYIDKEILNEYYCKSVLLFPSYIETFGLPLLEARLFGCPIIASDCGFSREILEGYDKAEFFNPFDGVNLRDIIRHIIIFDEF